MLRHKYGAVRTELDGRRFDSRAEAHYYLTLKLRQTAGEVVQFLTQVPFVLPGGVRYVVDFLEFHADGSVHWIDVKGRDTQASKNKRKQVEALYAPIKIEIVQC
jgi:hypothetical protein